MTAIESNSNRLQLEKVAYELLYRSTLGCVTWSQVYRPILPTEKVPLRVFFNVKQCMVRGIFLYSDGGARGKGLEITALMDGCKFDIYILKQKV